MKTTIAVVTLWLMLCAGTATAQTKCGSERWPVKTGGDTEAGDVNLDAPVDTTISQLRSLVPPDDLRHFEGRAPAELQVYTLDATLVLYKSESDSDLHLVLKDQGVTMIAEIPNLDCVPADSPFYDAISQVNDDFTAHFGNKAKAKGLHLRVRVTGVAMFDFLHGQTGVAPNGIELHPITGLEFLP